MHDVYRTFVYRNNEDESIKTSQKITVNFSLSIIFRDNTQLMYVFCVSLSINHFALEHYVAVSPPNVRLTLQAVTWQSAECQVFCTLSLGAPILAATFKAQYAHGT